MGLFLIFRFGWFDLVVVIHYLFKIMDKMKGLGIKKQPGKSWTTDAHGNYHVSRFLLLLSLILDSTRNFMQIIELTVHQ